MSQYFVIFFCVLLTALQQGDVHGNPVPILVSNNGAESVPKSEQSADNNKCAAIMQQVTKGASSFHLVGHAIHSMTVHDLRKFDQFATTVNFVPTINRDASARQALLPHAPEIVTIGDEFFLTEAMQTLNYDLSHMDESNIDMKGYSALERIVHSFHMQEIWARALKQFELIKANPPSAADCKCVLDIENNGILKYLRYTALAIREPNLIYGGGLEADKTRAYDINYDFSCCKAENEVQSSWDTHILKEKKDAQLPLTDSASWRKWATKFSAQMPHMDYNNALFIYCSVQKAHAVPSSS